MRPSTRGLLGVALVASLASRPAAQSQASPQAPGDVGTGIIVGRVVDAASHKGVDAATVTCITSGAAKVQVFVMTDGDGDFVCPNLPAGRYSITTKKAGYADSAYGVRRPAGLSTSLDLADGQRVIDASLTMWKFGVISGTVTDDAGDPVVGAIVRLLRRSVTNGEASYSWSGSSETDDRGMYRAGFLIPGDYLPAVASEAVTLPSSAGAAISQGTRAPGNSPALMNAVFSVIQSMSTPGSANYRESGNLVIQDVGRAFLSTDPKPDGSWSLYPTTFHPSAESAADAEVVTVDSGAIRSSIDLHLRLTATHRLDGVVMGPNGPAPNVAVKLIPAGANSSMSLTGFDSTGFETAGTITDSAGRFSLMGVAPGAYVLLARASSDDADFSPISMAASWWANETFSMSDRNATMNVVLHGAFELQGRLAFEGGRDQPQPDAMKRVSIQLQSTDQLSVRTVTARPKTKDDPSNIIAPNIVGGRYVMIVTNAPTGWQWKGASIDNQSASDGAFDVHGSNANFVVTFTDKISSVTGVVHDAHGAADADAVVLAFPVDRKLWASSATGGHRFAEVRPSKTGSYSVTELRNGDYFVIAVPDATAANWQDPKTLDALGRTSARISITDGSQIVQDLTTVIR